MRDYSKMNGYKPQATGKEKFNLVGVKEFNEKVSRSGKDMVEIIFDNDLKELLVINPETETFYGFSDVFLENLVAGFGRGKQGLGDVLNELASGSKRKVWVKGRKDYFKRDDGTIGYQFKVFKILAEEPNEEQKNHYDELADKASEDSRRSVEGVKSEVITTHTTDDEDLPFD